MNIYFGYALIIIAFIFAAIYLMLKFPKPGLAVTLCSLMVFTGIFIIIQERVTKLVFKGIGTIELAEEKAFEFLSSIDSLKAKIEKDTLELSLLSEKLDSMFKIDESGGIVPLKGLNVGSIICVENGGVQLFCYYPVTHESPDGTVHGGFIMLGGKSILKWTARSTGNGGVDSPFFEAIVDTFEVTGHFLNLGGVNKYYNAHKLKNNEELILIPQINGYGDIFTGIDFVHFIFNSTGEINIINKTQNFSNNDTSGKLCLYSSNSNIILKNRFNSSADFIIELTFTNSIPK